MNSITYYIKDIKGALDNNLYFSALALALTLPDICGLIMYPNLNSKARYKKWYDEYIGQYEQSPLDENNKATKPYFNGEACYSLRCAILHEGKNNIEDRDLQTINLDKFTLLLEEKNKMDLYCDSIVVGGLDNEATMDVQVRNICNKIVTVVECLIKKGELDISKMPNINVKNYGAEVRKLRDSNYQVKRDLLKYKDNYEPIFKYCSIESAKSILNNNCILLNNPQNFNDPFDALIDVTTEDEKESLELIYTYYFFDIIDRILNMNLQNVKGIQKFTIRFYKLIYRKYKNAIIRNGIFECNAVMKKLSSFFMGIIPDEENNKNKEDFSKKILNIIKQIRSSLIMSCFSKRYDSILMWSHYADKHRGVCIEFERPDGFFDVQYKKNRIPFNLVEATKRSLAYMASGNQLEYNDSKLWNTIAKPLLTKSLDWKYEEEVRCIFTPSCSNEELEMLDYGKYLYFMPSKIRRVYLGVNIGKEDKMSILEFCQKLKIEVSEIKLSENEYKIKLV